MFGNTSGKRQRRPPVTSSAAGINQLFYIDDPRSKRRFLIDTGAEVSVVPVPPHEKQGIYSSTSLVAANGSSIKTYGRRRLNFSLGKESYVWNFLIADVKRPILGADFLRNTGLLVDIRGQRLVNAESFNSVRLHGHLSTGPIAPAALDSIASAGDRFGHLLAEFPTITTPNFSCRTVNHGVQHLRLCLCAKTDTKRHYRHPILVLIGSLNGAIKPLPSTLVAGTKQSVLTA